jgi:ArsR family transcriptional regulator
LAPRVESTLESDVAIAKLFRALGHPSRLGVVRALSATPWRSATDLTGPLGLRQPTLSKHLAVLRRAGLVEYDGEGMRMVYALERSALVQLRVHVAQL